MALENGSGIDGAKIDDGGDKVDPIFGSGTPIIDPDAVGSGGSNRGESGPSAGEATRRGRKPGSKNRPRQAKATLDIDIAGVEKLLLSIHSGLAMLTSIREFELDPEEAKSLAAAVAKVSRHYPVLERISDKSVDHANLIAVVGGLYGTRFFAYKARTASDKARDVTNVTPMRPGMRTDGPAG